MPVDTQTRAFLDRMAVANAAPAHTLTPEQARANSRARPRPEGPEVARVEDRTVPGPAGAIPVRVYTPEGSGPFPVVMWFHGGGMVVGDLDIVDPTSRELCVRVGAVVVSVDYRLAPEHKFPAAPEDCYAATKWVAENAASLNADGSRIAVAGGSAGGNLAAAVALMARDRGGPLLAHQLLVYPMVGLDFETPSYRENADGYMLTRESMRWYWDHYLRGEADAADPYAAPLQARDLGGLPPALVITAEFDPLRDEGEAYARRLQEAGTQTTCTRYDGVIHGFFNQFGDIDRGKQALHEASTALRAALGG